MITTGSISCTSDAFAELSAEILGAGLSLRFRARGLSMSPLLRDGDVVWVHPVDSGSLRVGHVVLCRNEPGRLVLHRVVRTEVRRGERWFTVQGDQLARPDGVIPASQVYGRAVAIARNGRRIDLDRTVMSVLGWLAVLRSRWNLGHGRSFQRAARLVRRLPGLARYLA